MILYYTVLINNSMAVFPLINAQRTYLNLKLEGAALIGGRLLFQRKKCYLYKISKLCYHLFPNNNKKTVIMTHSVTYSRTTSFFYLFIYLYFIFIPYLTLVKRLAYS